MSQEGPSDGSEEGVVLDVGGTSSRTESTHLVLDEEFANHAFAETNRSDRKVTDGQQDSQKDRIRFP